MNSGQQAANGLPPDSGAFGIKFTADLNKTGIAGWGALVHNIFSVTNGNPSGVELDDGTRLNGLLRGDLSYPISDSPTAGVVPLYRVVHPMTGVTIVPVDIVANDIRHNFWAPDTPAFIANVPERTLARMDMTFQARMYLMWQYPDMPPPDRARVPDTVTVVALWDVATGKQAAVLKGHKDARAVAFSPDGKVLASGGGGIRLWDVASKKALATLEMKLWVDQVAFSPDGKLLAAASRGANAIQLWSLDGGK